MKRFGEKLKRLRIHNTMTLKDVAKALGYRAHGYISEIERGKKVPTTGFALAVAEMFDVSLDVLLRDSLDLRLPYRAQVVSDSEKGIPFINRPPLYQRS